MNSRLPIVLAVIAVLTSFLAWWPEPPPKSASLGEVGTVFGKEAPIDQAADLTVWTWNDELKGAEIFQVKKDAGRWLIPSRYNYPADGATRLGKTSGSVLNVKRGRFVTNDQKQFEELGVIDPTAENLDAGAKGRGKRIALKDQSGGVLVDIIIGNTATGTDGMKYVREKEKSEVYLAKIDAEISTKFIDWVEPDLLKVKKEDITTVKISDYSVNEASGRIEERGQTTLAKQKDKDEWSSPEAPADKRVAKAEVDKLLKAITELRLANIVRFVPDPAALKQTGFFLSDDAELVGRKDAFLVEVGQGHKAAVVPNEGEVSLTTKDGIRYRLFFGEIAPDDKSAEAKKDEEPEAEGKDDKSKGHNRYMIIFCEYVAENDLTPKEETKDGEDAKSKSKKPSGLDRAAAAQKRFLEYFYVISNSSFEGLRPKAETLFEAKPVEVMAGESGMTNAQRLEANGKKSGVTTTPSGLQYEVIHEGKPDGKQPTDTSEVEVLYKGTLVDGTEFDASKEGPTKFRVDGVIKGWGEALKLMREGDKWRLFIPPELAYGDKKQGDKIGPNSILIFEVELIRVVN
jgi:FKBP-type peptidyl-prolyl cis-trans isomerase